MVLGSPCVAWANRAWRRPGLLDPVSRMEAGASPGSDASLLHRSAPSTEDGPTTAVSTDEDPLGRAGTASDTLCALSEATTPARCAEGRGGIEPRRPWSPPRGVRPVEAPSGASTASVENALSCPERTPPNRGDPRRKEAADRLSEGPRARNPVAPVGGARSPPGLRRRPNSWLTWCSMRDVSSWASSSSRIQGDSDWNEALRSVLIGARETSPSSAAEWRNWGPRPPDPLDRPTALDAGVGGSCPRGARRGVGGREARAPEAVEAPAGVETLKSSGDALSAAWSRRDEERVMPVGRITRLATGSASADGFWRFIVMVDRRRRNVVPTLSRARAGGGGSKFGIPCIDATLARGAPRLPRERVGLARGPRESPASPIIRGGSGTWARRRGEGEVRVMSNGRRLTLPSAPAPTIDDAAVEAL